MNGKVGLAVALLGAGTGVAHADSGIAIGAGIGTTGGSVEAQAQVTPYIQLRGGYNFFEYDVDDEYDDIAYDGQLDLTTWGAFVDFRPWGNSFFVSAGAYFGEKGLDMTATPTANVEIGGQTFTPSEVGTLALDAGLEDTAPFLGLGWDTTFQGSGPVGFKLLLGAMYTGSPDVMLTSSGGTLSNDPNFQQELANEEANLQSDVDDYEYYPVIQAGLTFRF